MTEQAALAEEPSPDRAIPSFEIPGWREQLGVVAGITGRRSPDGDFDLGLASPQPAGAVIDRWLQLQAAFPHFAGAVVGRQVHGTDLGWHERLGGWCVVPGIDGHATQAAGLLLTVSVADCVPVYLLDPRRRAVALLHAGWRGTAAGILERGVELLAARAGSRPGDLIVHLGVAICGPCYQVGPEVALACGQPAAAGESTRLDLRLVLRGHAQALGVDRITVSPWCSAHHRDRFFSHRGSGGNDGRMVAFLGLEP
jgi:hypothetical protein